MRQNELQINLIAALSQFYNLDPGRNLAEFLQGEINVLNYLFQNINSEINPSILSDKLHVSRSRITTALSSLRKKGYVNMEMSENDRRRMLVSITQNGVSFIKEKQEKLKEYFDTLIKGLGEKNAMELNRLIELLIQITNEEGKEALINESY